MKETWRWFGPQDPISLAQVEQAGATGIVTALHHIYRGEAWPLAEVMKRKAEIEAAGLVWSVVESIPVHNSIKLRSGNFRSFIDAWKDSLAAIAQAGIKVVCYNFMPVVDWTRTDLKWALPSTGYALRFDAVDFAVYDVLILQRKNAERQYNAKQLSAARARFEAMPESRRANLEQTIIAGLPGAEASYDRDAFRRQLSEYEGVTPADLRANLREFLREIVPVAAESGVRLCIHPDDPPWPLFGLPRVVSTAEDVREIFGAAETPANGLTFCVGSFGAREDNDLVAMIREFAPRIHFAHLRQVGREEGGSFHEAEHLDGSSDMIGAVRALLEEEARRRDEARADDEIPMRPDHGHLLADDIGKKTNPGYSYVGRLKGLAELRGAMRGLRNALPGLNDHPQR
jgi:mannonate dehydratase